MAWFKVDDNFAFHPKVLNAGNAAAGLWVRAGTWSMQTLSDGFIPSSIALRLGTKREAARLVQAGLWDECEGGYVFHQWSERQPTSAQVKADRASGAARLKRWREAKRDESEEKP